MLLVPDLLCAQAAPPAASSTCAPFSTPEEAENFLRTAPIVTAKVMTTGVSLPVKMMLDDGKVQHAAIFKSIDERKPGVSRLNDSVEVDFKDSWKFEVAAYQLDRALGLNMVPVTVQRSYNGRRGSIQLWMDNCIMETERLRKGIQPPDPVAWNHQIYKMRLFDNLIYNSDRNLQNMLVSADWKCFMVDHSRSFKNLDQLKLAADLTHFSVSLMERLKSLDKESLAKQCEGFLSGGEISALLKRRDRIVKHFEKRLAQMGPEISYP
jgi:hypothetical protein